MNRDELLLEMGLKPLWKLRDAPDGVAAAALPEDVPAAFAAMGAAHEDVSAPPSAKDLTASPAAGEREAAIARMDWDELQGAVAECRACGLCKQRKQAVLGVGDRQADWLFIGEGPGAEEDERGEPFVGQAGRLLDNMLAAIDLRRGEDVYIANAVKCRPPGNRTPEPEEMAICRPFLERQIALIRPKLIVLLGRAAMHSVLNSDKSLSGMRGVKAEHGGIPVVVTYHPAYLLRNLPDKAKAWEDLCRARKLMSGLKRD